MPILIRTIKDVDWHRWAVVELPIKKKREILYVFFFLTCSDSWTSALYGGGCQKKALECLRFFWKYFSELFSEGFQNPILKNPKKALTQPDFWISEVLFDFFCACVNEIYFSEDFQKINFMNKNFWKTFWKHFWKTYFYEINANSHYFTILQIELVWGMFHIIYNPYMH